MSRQTGMKGLQQWCKQVTEGYKDVEITNMTTSFRDGLAFCAIIHRYRPDLIPFDTLKKGDVAKNNQLAFSVAEEVLDIPALLDVQDMVDLNVPDKLSIATYLSTYYNYFKNIQPAPGTPPGSQKPTGDNKINVPAKAESPERSNKNESKISPAKAPLSKTSSPLLPPSKPAGAWKKNNQSESESSSSKTTPAPTPSTAANQGPVLPATNQPTTGTRGRKQKFTPAADTPVATETATNIEPPLKPPTRRKSKKVEPANGEGSPSSVTVDVCEGCGQRVFLMQKVNAEGHVFHRSCFRCRKCDITLQSKVYEYDSHDDKFFCRTHFNEMNRQRSIKKKMDDRGIKSFDEDNIPKKLNHVVANGGEKKLSPLLTKKQSASTDELSADQIKEGLPSLLSNLAQKKMASETAAESATPNNSESKLPPTTSGSKLPLTTSRSSPPRSSPPRPKLPSTTSGSKPLPTSSGSKLPLTTSRSSPPRPKLPPTTSASTTSGSKLPPGSSPPRPKLPPTTSGSTTSGSKLPPTSSVSSPPRPKLPPTTSASKLPPTTTTTSVSTTTTKTELAAVKSSPLDGSNKTPSDIPPNTTRQSVGAWWKKREEEQKKQNGAKPEHKPKEKPPSFNATDDSVTTTVLEHYEFGPNYFKENPKAQEILEERYETLENIEDSNDSLEAGEYEVPINLVPSKPPRKKKGAKINEPHPPRHSETWTKPYAMTNVTEDDSNAPPRLSRKPSRPAPPPPQKLKPKYKKQGQVSPYAISDVNNRSPIRDDLKAKRRQKMRVYQMQLQEVTEELNRLERKGVELEQYIRSQDDDTEDDRLIEEWFSLVHHKNEVVKKEADLVYLIRDIELIEQHDNLDQELRIRLSKDDATKTELEKVEEGAMMDELFQLVMLRNQLLLQHDDNKKREEELDDSLRSITQKGKITGITID